MVSGLIIGDEPQQNNKRISYTQSGAHRNFKMPPIFWSLCCYLQVEQYF